MLPLLSRLGRKKCIILFVFPKPLIVLNAAQFPPLTDIRHYLNRPTSLTSRSIAEICSFRYRRQDLSWQRPAAVKMNEVTQLAVSGWSDTVLRTSTDILPTYILNCMHCVSQRMDYQTWALRLLLTVLIFYENVDSGAIMGPAEVNFKFLEKCKWTTPKMLDMDIRLYQRKGKLLLNANITFPYQFSDEIGYDMNVAVKRSGGWISNFLKFKGKGACTGVMNGEKNLFKMLAKELNAPDPPRCPLPAGKVKINYEGADPTAAMKQYGLEVMPYGEFRVSANFTHKEDIILCVKAFIDLVPKKTKKSG